MLLHVNMSVNKCFFIMWSVARGLIEGWSAEMSQNVKFMMDIFFLEAELEQFPEDLQYGTSYVGQFDCWLLI
jgi:hypothetical protein